MVDKDEPVATHANGHYPCPFGCIYDEYRSGKLKLMGDCRMPESHRCWLNQERTIRRLQAEAANKNDS